MQILQICRRLARKSPREVLWRIQSRLGETDRYWKVRSPGNDRTTYVIGLYGSGRDYIGELIRRHLGQRAKYFRDVGGKIRLRQVATSMIYSGHATLKHPSIGQASPTVTGRLIEASKSGMVDLIFIYRHPLDSLLTNWMWGSQIKQGAGRPSYVSQIYKNTEDLCAHLERNFSDFKAFAEGDAQWFTAGQPPFLSFREFVEETELLLQVATLALRLEDFMVDPLKEFSKIAEAMSVDLDLAGLQLDPPRTRPYRYLSVRQAVPQFRDFLNELDGETRRRIEKCGYQVDIGEGCISS